MTETLQIALIGLVSAVIGSGATVLVGLFVPLFSKPKTKADATEVIGKAYGDLFDQMKERMDDMSNEISNLRKENQNIRTDNLSIRSELDNTKSSLGELKTSLLIYRDRVTYMVRIVKDLFCQLDGIGVKPIRDLPKWAEEFDDDRCK